MPRSSFLFAALGLLSALTVLAQFALNVESRGGAVPALVSLLGYFSIWTNVLLAFVCLWLARRIDDGWSARRISLATATTLFIVFVGVVYHLLLSDDHDPRGIRFVTNLLLHYLVPAGMLALWLTSVPKGRLRFGSALVWLAFPFAYLVHVLVRGAILGRYPYFFVNVEAYGYPQVLLNTLGLTVMLLILGIGFVGLDRTLGRLRHAQSSQASGEKQLGS